MNQKEKIEASEEKIQETICKSKNAFLWQNRNECFLIMIFVDTASCHTKKMVGSSIYNFSGIMDCFKFYP